MYLTLIYFQAFVEKSQWFIQLFSVTVLVYNLHELDSSTHIHGYLSIDWNFKMYYGGYGGYYLFIYWPINWSPDLMIED